MNGLVQSALALAQTILPYVTGNSTLISQAVQLVAEAAPLVAKSYQKERPKVVAIIQALRADAATNREQLALLMEAEKVLDADFDAAAQKAADEDAADAAAGL